MSKYDKLWEYVGQCTQPEIKLTFEQVGEIAGVSMDHSFLSYKKELTAYGYRVGKISLKAQTVTFSRLDP